MPPRDSADFKQIQRVAFPSKQICSSFFASRLQTRQSLQIAAEPPSFSRGSENQKISTEVNRITLITFTDSIGLSSL